MLSRSETSIFINVAIAPIFCTAARPAFSLRAPMNTRKPLAVSCRATSKPIPLFAPVTSAIFSDFVMIFTLRARPSVATPVSSRIAKRMRGPATAGLATQSTLCGQRLLVRSLAPSRTGVCGSGWQARWSNQPPQRPQIHHVFLHFLAFRCLQDLGDLAETPIVHNETKCREPDLTLANVQ